MRPRRTLSAVVLSVLTLAACEARKSAPSASAPPASAVVVPRATPKDSEPAAIVAIRDHFAQIERELPTYRRDSTDLMDKSTEGGILYAYLAGDSLRKLVAKYYGESGRATASFFYWRDSLVFVFRVDERYDRTLSGNVIAREENRYYFENHRLIRWLGPDGRLMSLASSDARDAEKQYLSDDRELRELLWAPRDSVTR